MAQTHQLKSKSRASRDIKSQVAILDAGAQYGKVIDRRIRNLKVKSDLLPLETSAAKLTDYTALILSGGPESVYDKNSPTPDPKIFSMGKPILGICYGLQLINQAFGGTVEAKDTREDGQFDIKINTDSPIFTELDFAQKVLMSHGDSIGRIAPGFRQIASSGQIAAAIADQKRRIYGLQFHPEVDLTEGGEQILKNFIFKIAELRADFTLDDRLEEALTYIRHAVGKRQVLTFVSGGVDSTLCSALLGIALPAKQVKAVHIDTGFMRHNESRVVCQALKTTGIKVRLVTAENDFYNATTIHNGHKTLPLKNVADPEIKRHIIGDAFVRVMDKIIKQLKLDPLNTVLAQGTLRPDLIESASKIASNKAAVIKTHHNDTRLVRQLRDRGQVIEPLKDLHKDEVRKLAEKLNLPSELVWRQPFPGPGLAIRLLCAKSPYITKEFDKVSSSLEQFADPDIATNLLPVRTVGVQGDGRTYSYIAALSGQPDWQRLFYKAQQIPKTIHQINRVVYVFGNKLSPQTINITPTFPEPEAIEQLRLADWKANQVLRKHKLTRTISQMPVVSFPVTFGKPGNRSIGLRPFITNDFMTGAPAIPGNDIDENIVDEIVDALVQIDGISKVAYDLTTKPPGTTEWE